MTAVLGYLIAATIATCAALLLAGPRHLGRRDPTFEIHDVTGRMAGIQSAFGGFAVTGLVFLVTQSRNVADPTGVSFTTVVTMFFVAYVGYSSSSLLFANVSGREQAGPFDLAAAQYAGASVQYFSIFLGWLALKPLLETFGLTSVAQIVGWLLIAALVGGYGLLAGALHRTGYASPTQLAWMALLAILVTVAYGVAITLLVPGFRSAEATLYLTVLGFLLGVPAYAVLTTLPIAARRERLAPILAARWHLAVIFYAQSVMVLLGFILLGIFGLA